MLPVLSVITVLIATETLVRGHKENDDARLNFTGLATKYGQNCEEHKIMTEDGYILTVFHIIGDRSKPVILNHGALGTSDSFILRGNTSLAITLARKAYDVWAMNDRGNRYSREHVSLDPERNRTYWHFSGHEFGYYDVPAVIDYVLNATGQAKLSAVGFSEGTFAFYVMGATRPEYNDKIKVFISLAPICYIHNIKPFASEVAKYFPDVNRGLLKSHNEEFIAFHSPAKRFIDFVCTLKYIGYNLCLLSVIFPVAGFDSEEIERDFFPVIVGHFPAGSSRQNLNHFSQISNNKRVTMYDYGVERNMAIYKAKVPPEYDLGKITMKVAMFVARNDRMSTVKDAKLLRKRLPNVVKFQVMKPPNFNHVDFVWGRNTHKYLFPDIMQLLEEYS